SSTSESCEKPRNSTSSTFGPVGGGGAFHSTLPRLSVSARDRISYISHHQCLQNPRKTAFPTFPGFLTFLMFLSSLTSKPCKKPRVLTFLTFRPWGVGWGTAPGQL